MQLFSFHRLTGCKSIGCCLRICAKLISQRASPGVKSLDLVYQHNSKEAAIHLSRMYVYVCPDVLRVDSVLEIIIMRPESEVKTE